MSESPNSKPETKKVASAKSSSGDSKEALLEAAKKVFAAKGFEGATVKDLADEAGVNVSLVSYHFGGKESLYLCCIEGFGLSRLDSIKRILKDPNSTEEFKLRLRLFAEDFIEIHRREPHACKVVQAAMDSMNPLALQTFQEVFFKIFATLREFVRAAQTKGFVRSDLDAELAAAMMFGGLMHLLRAQELMKSLGMRDLSDEKYANDVVDHWLAVNCDGVMDRNQSAQSGSTPEGAQNV